MTPKVAFADAPWHRGPAPAVIDGERVWDYAALTALVDARAWQLVDLGLMSGQLVLVPDLPAWELILMQHALARAGAALLPVDGGCSSEHARGLVEVTGAEWRWRLAGPGEAGRLVTTGVIGDQARPPDAHIAAVIETSGSSGAPKAAMLTPANLLASAAAVNRRLGLVAGDTWLCCLRPRHIAGLAIGYRCALAGATLLLHDGFDARAVCDDLARHPVTHISLVPPMLARLLGLRPEPPPSLRVLLVGGQALSGPLARRAVDAGWPLHVTYGMTETGSQIATSGRLSAAPEPGVVGALLPGVEADCPDCSHPPRPLRVRGPLVMAGYANPARLPGQGLDDGWFRTSDLACLDGTGRLRVLGRADDLVVVGGVQVLPARVEDVLQGAPGVTAAAVVAVPDAEWGHRLAAAYRGDADVERLEAWCRQHLPSVERPRRLLRLPDLPVLESGKYDREGIRALFARDGDD